MFNKYYQEELSFLREMGREFAEKYPVLAHFLAEPGSDPDVERLLEGFAFLTGRIRQKLDDELPELTHTMMELLWPHYLRPVPSLAILEFEPQRTLRGPYRVPRIVTEVESRPVDGTRCRFRTCYDVDLLPLTLEEVALEGQRLRLRFQLLSGLRFAELSLQRMRLHLHGDAVVKSTLYFWLRRYVQGVTIQAIGDGQANRQIRLGGAHIQPVGFGDSGTGGSPVLSSPAHIQPVGFGDADGLIPYPPTSAMGYRVLQEYFAFPNKFMFVDLTGLEPAASLGIEDAFEITIYFSRRPDEPLRVGKDNIRLNCTPVVNLFTRKSDPIRVEQNRAEYRVRPEGPNSQHYEVYSVDGVIGWVQGTVQQHEYTPFYSFKHGLNASNRDTVYYQTRLRSSVVSEDTTETYMSFVTANQSGVMPPTETVSLELTCMNRRLAEQLPVGAINQPTSSSPEFARFRNITNVTPAIRLPLDESLHWRLISHLSLNRLPVVNQETLRGLLGLYNFQAFYDRQAAEENQRRLEGILDVHVVLADQLYHGAPIRGRVTQIEMLEDHFGGEGGLYLFACVLNEFLALDAIINSFSQLIVRSAKTGEVYEWPPRIGKQILL